MQRPGNLSEGNWKDLALKCSRCEPWIYPTIHLLSATLFASFLVWNTHWHPGPTLTVFWRVILLEQNQRSINFNVKQNEFSVQCYSWGCSRGTGVDLSWHLTRDRVYTGQVTSQSQELRAECLIWHLSSLVLQLATCMRVGSGQVIEVYVCSGAVKHGLY